MMEIVLKQPYSFCQTGRRENQEDARFPDDNTPVASLPVFVVCDGVGGLSGGEFASQTVTSAAGRAMARFDLSKPFATTDFKKVLSEIYSALKADKRGTRDKATTLTFLCFHGGGVMVAHCGDSRVYQIRPGVGIISQTRDHSLVAALVDSGNLTPQEAVDHPQSNVITRCISATSPASVSVLQTRDVEAGDYFFMCTDGVVHCISDNELYEIISSSMSDSEKISEIARLSRYSYDNNTAYLIGVADVVDDVCEIDEATATTDRGDSDVSVSAATRPIDCKMPVIVDVTVPDVASSHSFLDKIKKILTR